MNKEEIRKEARKAANRSQYMSNHIYDHKSYEDGFQEGMNQALAMLSFEELEPVFIPPFRVGRKQKRAVLDAKGMEVVVFPKGLESYAKEYVSFLNSTHKNKSNVTYKDINQPLGENVFSSSCLLEVIDKLPHSKSRVPYTYHHDYLRQHSKAHSGMSRADVASSHTADDVELYAIALTQILSEVGADSIYHINSSDVFICKKAKEITEAAMSRYNSR